MTDKLPVHRPGSDLAESSATSPLAERTVGQLQQERVRIVWQRITDPALHTWVRVDNVVVLGDELVDIGSGAGLTEPRSAFLGLQPWSQQRWEPWIVPIAAQGPDGADWCETRIWDGLLVVGKRTGIGGSPSDLGMLVEARDPATGQAAWHYRASGLVDYVMWSDWLKAGDSAVLKRPSRSILDWLQYPDTRTGGCRWSLPWDSRGWQADRAASDGGGELVIVFDSDRPAVGGIEAGSGRVRWRIDTPAGTIPVAVRAATDHVVVCSFPEDTNRHMPYVSVGGPPPIVLAGACSCHRKAARADEPNECRRCGGFFRPWMTVSVHDRRTGAELWSHRWPWHDVLGTLAVVQAVQIVEAAAGWIIVTQEQGFLRARRLADKTPLWSHPVDSLPGLPSLARLRELGLTAAFHATGRQPRPTWVWLQEVSGSVADGTRGTHDLFIHPSTGALVALTDVFHLSPDGYALARTGNTVTCLALPVMGGHGSS